ncbi:hypothetical protein FA10DRAFT_138582 [Acaromyces ingoldii]|uniref:Uncharacterized protein n=1 Tax=Acaromyces ingoldii TaxID=215250 RepID=A0A316YJ54_9BASI|nr:hypothetical protein FA10DRAFT_138582 [Acaromyces ingoldii]PWN89221.1 hypothetical protein FA10DRAFT_138582 [Acaromyces ingoldii]
MVPPRAPAVLQQERSENDEAQRMLRHVRRRPFDEAIGLEVVEQRAESSWQGGQAALRRHLEQEQEQELEKRDMRGVLSDKEGAPQRRQQQEPGQQQEVKRDVAQPAPNRAAPLMPRATAAPMRRSAEDPVRLRVREEHIVERQQRSMLDKRGLEDDKGKRAQGEDIVLGPFYARSQEDVERMRRQVGIDRRALQDGEAVGNAKRYMQEEDAAARNLLLERDWYRARAAEHEVQEHRLLTKRQTEAEQQCFVGNEKLSCYPTANTRVDQGTWSKLIWNSNYPEFTNNGGYVDVYLFHQDSDQVATSWTSIDNGQGRLSFNPGDSWWQGREPADNFNGTDIAWPFYFVITYAGAGLSGTTHRLSTWFAVQTALPVAVAESRSSASVAASLSSAAASASAASAASATMTGSDLSSLSASEAAASSSFAASLSSALVSSLQSQGLSGTQTLQGTATTTLDDGRVITATATGQANGQLPAGSNGEEGGLPAYAIALIVVFGFLALVAALVGAYFLMAAARRRRERGGQGSHAGSDTPMMAGVAGGGSDEGDDDMMREVGVAGAGAAAGAAASRGREADTPFSSNEASRMAEAFRAALRRPQFFGGGSGTSAQQDEGTSPGNDSSGSGGNQSSPGEGLSARDSIATGALLRDELAAEGHDLRYVGDRRKPTIEGE